jgi:glyoxylase-like metal-dependent hydrolase (beta-lactamase superfamily II)
MRLRNTAIAIVACLTTPLRAQTPPVKTQAPGFYRFMLGDFEITALNDGVIPYPTKTVLPTATPEDITSGLFAAGLTDPVGMSYNGFLVNTGTKLVLIDVGTGGKLNDSPYFRGAGRLLQNLRDAGHRPEQIDEIYISHFGPDHIGALTHDSKPTFPKAKVRAAQAEVAAFLESRTPTRDSTMRVFRAGAFEPYMTSGRFERIDGDLELVPGIRALATPGHTPGHTSYLVESKGQTLLILGDVVHLGALQFAHPALPTIFDADQKGGASQRERIFRLAAEKDYWVAGAHLPFPGIGHIRADAGRYRWAPVNYTIPD